MKEQYFGVYAEKDDMTFVMHEYTDMEGCIHVDCIGWVFGRITNEEIAKNPNEFKNTCEL